MTESSTLSRVGCRDMSKGLLEEAAPPITVIILSWNWPIFLWACLDSLFRYTRRSAEFVLIDNDSDDPLVHQVISGFERRGMFTSVERCTSNSPDNLTKAFERYRHSSSEYIGYVDSDVQVFDTEPCWLAQMTELMDADPNLGLLGSYIDTRDFVDPALARRLAPELDAYVLSSLIKAESPERHLSPTPPEVLCIEPFNPPGRLTVIRKTVLDLAKYGDDLEIYNRLKEAGIGAAIATRVRHRHLSLLNLFDYPHYDMIARDAYYAAGNAGAKAEKI